MGELYRYLGLRKSEFTQSEKSVYASLLPKFRRWFVEQLVDDKDGAFHSALNEYVAHLLGSGDVPEPTKLFMCADGAVPILLECRRVDCDEGFAKLPMPLVEQILDTAYMRPGAVEVGPCTKRPTKQLEGSQLYLLAACARPYHRGPLVLLKELTPEFAFGWQHVSYSRAPDPLCPFADKVMDELLRALPGVFEKDKEDDWADQMRAELDNDRDDDSYDIDYD